MAKKTAADEAPETTDEGGAGRKKTECNISRADFAAHAKPITLSLDGTHIKTLASVPVYEFGSGSLGWFLQEKGKVIVNGVECKVQLQVTMTLVGSKELPE
jgi:hypothetical protein